MIELAHRAFDFGMALVADHDELVAFLVRAWRPRRAPWSPAGRWRRRSRSRAPRLRAARPCSRRGRENTSVAPGGTSARSSMKIAPFGLQVVDDEGVVHDLVAHVDRRAELARARARRSRWRGRRRRRSRAARPARSLPRRAPRPSQHSDHLHFEGHRLAGERMVEVEQHAQSSPASSHHAGVARPGRRALGTAPRRRPRSSASGSPCSREQRARAPTAASPGCARRRLRRRQARSARARLRPGRSGALPSPGASSPVPSDSVAGLPSKVLMMSAPSGPARR